MKVQTYSNNCKMQVQKENIIMSKSQKRSDCPVSCSLDVWGDKWSLLIIRDLMFAKQSTYGDFLKSGEGIATNILAARLQVMEENKLIEKLNHPDSKAKVLYRLTQKGIDLFPVMVEIFLWADKHFTMPEVRKPMLRAIKKDKVEYIRTSMKALKKV